jgi:hypothetical protein
LLQQLKQVALRSIPEARQWRFSFFHAQSILCGLQRGSEAVRRVTDLAQVSVGLTNLGKPAARPAKPVQDLSLEVQVLPCGRPVSARCDANTRFRR